MSYHHVLAAIKAGDLSEVKRLGLHTLPVPKNACDVISDMHNEHIDIMIYALAQGYKPSVWVLINSAERGHLNFIKMFHEQLPKDPRVATMAMVEGHNEILQFLTDHEYPIPASFVAPIRERHMHTIKWLYEHGLSASTEDLNIAALLDNVDIVKFLLENGCEWDHVTVKHLMGNHNLTEVVEILKHYK